MIAPTVHELSDVGFSCFRVDLIGLHDSHAHGIFEKGLGISLDGDLLIWMGHERESSVRAVCHGLELSDLLSCDPHGISHEVVDRGIGVELPPPQDGFILMRRRFSGMQVSIQVLQIIGKHPIHKALVGHDLLADWVRHEFTQGSLLSPQIIETFVCGDVLNHLVI